MKEFLKRSFLPTGLIFLAMSFSAQAQLVGCGSNLENAISNETFLTGTTNGPALPAGTIDEDYTFTDGAPDDGFYTVSSSTTDYFDWHEITDHTIGDTNGKMLIVNADFAAGEFYNRTISDLCPNTSYEFSAWVLNLVPTANSCPGNVAIPINVKFEIRDVTGNPLGTLDTGDIPSTSSPVWRRQSLTFRTAPGQTSVVLRMINNRGGGCGNDLAIDDIVFRSCGDNVTLTDTDRETSLTACENIGASTTLTAEPDFLVFNDHFYQWQQSADSVSWVDIDGANDEVYTTPLLTEDTFYRVKVAEDANNLPNLSCVVLSEVFDVLIVPLPDTPLGNDRVFSCNDGPQELTVSVPNGISVNWYDAPIGGTLLLADSTTYTSQTPGIYYAEAVSELPGCVSLDRITISLFVNDMPVVTNESLVFCEGETISLTAETYSSYRWSTGETTQTIDVTQEGIYTVTVTNASECSAVKTIDLRQIDQPIIDTIVSDFRNIVVNLVTPGDYEYALNDDPFQDSPVLGPVKGGLYTVSVRGKSNCSVVSVEFLHFVVPNFFTPNGDGSNDLFVLEGIELYERYEISIFDRYGRLLRHSINNGISWDGTFRSVKLPASDYWYLIQTDDVAHQGHFALKR